MRGASRPSNGGVDERKERRKVLTARTFKYS